MSSIINIDEAERERIVKSGPVYLANGLRATLAGYKFPDGCGVTSALPGFWECSWETAQEVVSRPDRRFLPSDRIWKTGSAWLGCRPGPGNFQTPEDYAVWRAKQ